MNNATPPLGFVAEPRFGKCALTKEIPQLKSSMVLPTGEIEEFNTDNYKDSWLVLFSYPKDFTYVCPTELNELADRIEEFKKLGATVIGVSCDSEEVHLAWMDVPRKKGGIQGITYPLIADVDRSVTAGIGALLDANIGTRATLIFGKGTLRHASFNEPPVGRSIDEILRLVAAFQYTDEHGEVCPAKWTKPGDATMVADRNKAQTYFDANQ